MSSSSSSSSDSSTSSFPTSSQTSGSTFMDMPTELFEHVDAHLSFEDSTSFKNVHPVIDLTLLRNFEFYDKLHICDDETECWISDTRQRVLPRKFKPNNCAHIIRSLPGLKDITVIMKEVNIKGRQSTMPQKHFTDVTPYTPGGYLLRLLGEVPPAELALRQLSVHIDVMIESLQDVYLHCPTEDLKYCMEKLVNAPFTSFVQISICCAQIRPNDEFLRNYLLQGMQYALKQSHDIGAKTEFVVEPCEGYVDMTIEKGNCEYSFAFFYYNPTICDPTPDDAPPTIPLMTNFTHMV